jgi:hypothetical protein
MGCGTFTASSFASYSVANHKSYDVATNRISGQQFYARQIDKGLDPRNFKERECANNEEHPNTIPVILALDVTGSMGAACKETAEALGVIITNLYEKFKDIEFCIMGIGDLAYDHAPIQMSQFESDVRIAEALDKLYMEHGGGGNGYESYTAAWYMGLYHTKLDCFDKQNRKGIIITMGDEPMNPYLPITELRAVVATKAQANIETKDLFDKTSEKFNIFHIAVDSDECMYRYYAKKIDESFGQLLGTRLKVSTIQNLAGCIEDCITEAIEGTEKPKDTPVVNPVNEDGEISW